MSKYVFSQISRDVNETVAELKQVTLWLKESERPLDETSWSPDQIDLLRQTIEQRLEAVERLISPWDENKENPPHPIGAFVPPHPIKGFVPPSPMEAFVPPKPIGGFMSPSPMEAFVPPWPTDESSADWLRRIDSTFARLEEVGSVVQGRENTAHSSSLTEDEINELGKTLAQGTKDIKRLLDLGMLAEARPAESAPKVDEDSD